MVAKQHNDHRWVWVIDINIEFNWCAITGVILLFIQSYCIHLFNKAKFWCALALMICFLIYYGIMRVIYILIHKKMNVNHFATFHFCNLLIKILPYTETRYYFYMFSGTWNTNRIPSYSCCKTWIFLPDIQRPEHLAAQSVSVTETLLNMINCFIWKCTVLESSHAHNSGFIHIT